MTSSAFDSSRQGCGSGQCACRRAAQTRRADPFDDTDYGTPTRHADTDVTLDIDGRAVTVPAGTSVMRAAIEAGINVPKLCATIRSSRSARVACASSRSKAGAAIRPRARRPSRPA